MSKVGYKRPPAHTRFRKGKSGNPKGRPKGRKNVRSLLLDILSENVVVTENGKSRTITKREAFLRKVVNGGLMLQPHATERLWRITCEIDDEEAAKDAERNQKRVDEIDLEILERLKLAKGGK